MNNITTKAVTSYANRIKRALSSFNVMGEMMLELEINAMSPELRLELQQALANRKNPISYKYLNDKVMQSNKAAA